MSWQMWDSRFAQPATAALLHFIWEGAVLGFMAYAAMRHAMQARTKYAIACGALVAMALAPAITFWMNVPDAPRSVHVIGVDWDAQMGGADLPMASAAFEWRRFVLPLWLAGVVVLAIRAVGGWSLAVWQVRRSRIRASHEIEDAVPALAERFGVRRAIRVFASARTRVPAVFGWLRPVLLVPVSAMTGLGPNELRAILAHEVAHIARHDFVVNCLQSALEVLLFYHPAVWWVSHRIREEREMCCDAAAVEVCGDAVRYSRALLALEEGRQHFALAVNGGSLKRRVERLLVPQKPAGPFGIAAAGILVVVCGGVAVSTLPAVAKGPVPGPARIRTVAALTPAPALSQAEQKTQQEIVVLQRLATSAAARRPVVLIMNRAEQDQYAQLQDDAARDAFVERFWASRTPEERAEHQRRVTYAERFRTGAKPGWDTGRGRVYVQQGSPDQIETHSVDDPLAQSETWRYVSSGREYRFQGADYEMMSMTEKIAGRQMGRRRGIPVGARRPVVFIMSREQQDEYVLLQDEIARDAFIERFWAARTPAERAEHEVRVRYANERYADPGHAGWDTPRGRTYIKDGPPDEIESHPAENFEVWRYNNPRRVYTFSGDHYDAVNIEFGGAGGMIAIGTARRANTGDMTGEVTVDIKASAGEPGGWAKTGANPTYPPLALRARVQGDVVLRGTTSPDGTVQTLTAVSGHPLLVPSAMEAARKWIIQPTDTASQFEATLHFSLKPAKP